MKKEPVYIYVANKEAPNDIFVYKCSKPDNVPGKLVTKLLEQYLVGTKWLPFVVNSFALISNMNIIAFTENRAEFLNIINQQKQLD